MLELVMQNWQLYSISEVARQLRISRASVNKLIDEGKIGFITLSKQKKIPQQEVDRFIKENTIRAVNYQKEAPQEKLIIHNYKPTEEIFLAMWKEFNNGKRIL